MKLAASDLVALGSLLLAAFALWTNQRERSAPHRLSLLNQQLETYRSVLALAGRAEASLAGLILSAGLVKSDVLDALRSDCIAVIGQLQCEARDSSFLLPLSVNDAVSQFEAVLLEGLVGVNRIDSRAAAITAAGRLTHSLHDLTSVVRSAAGTDSLYRQAMRAIRSKPASPIAVRGMPDLADFLVATARANAGASGEEASVEAALEDVIDAMHAWSEDATP
jgi:hypothetical protein